MESAASREKRELLRQQSIQRQIAQLQAQLLDSNALSLAPSLAPSPAHATSLEDTKRKRQDVAILAPASPQHKKRRVTPPVAPPRKPEGRGTDGHRNLRESNASDEGAALPPQPGPSNVLSKLSALSKRATSPVESDAPMRTSSFADKASGVPARDDQLMLMEELEPGPYEHKSPVDDSLFGRLEPHSGIRLASRNLPHEDLQDYMTGRYYISPSRLYSVLRTQPGGAAGARGQVYDVPVVGDWVTIAVVAERSPVRVSRAPVAIGPGEARDADDLHSTPASSVPPATARNPKPAGKKKDPDLPPQVAGRKYVNMTLIDFGAGGSGKKGAARGDAVLSLLLFESDSYDTVSRGDGLLPEKIYKGGSRGAFETMAKLREGSVVALLNPRILKPLQKPGAPNILALTPESAGSVAIIGTARDLGMCGVVKRDGKPCGSWFDKRVSDVCDYHVQHAVQRCRAGRPEFSAGTSGMGMSSGSQRRKSAYDPQRKWGLAPANGSAGSPSSSQVDAGGPTYVVAGHIVAGAVAGKHDMFLKETVGREAQARAARKASSHDTDVTLKRLLARDKEGMRAVQEAREFAKKTQKKKQRTAGGKEVGKEEAGVGDDDDDDYESGTDDDEESCESGDGASADRTRPTTTTKNAYTARVIKELGFDPTSKSSRGGHGQRREGEDSRNKIYSELRELASCRQLDRIRLGPRPGGRVLSVVSAPEEKSKSKLSLSERRAALDSGGHDGMVDLDESSGEEEL